MTSKSLFLPMFVLAAMMAGMGYFIDFATDNVACRWFWTAAVFSLSGFCLPKARYWAIFLLLISFLQGYAYYRLAVK